MMELSTILLFENKTSILMGKNYHDILSPADFFKIFFHDYGSAVAQW